MEIHAANFNVPFKVKALDLLTNDLTRSHFEKRYGVVRDVITLPEFIQSQFSQGARLANRALIDRKTLRKVENGDAGVSAGAFATNLFVLGMTDRLAEPPDARFDRFGLALEEERLPKRIRSVSRLGSTGTEK